MKNRLSLIGNVSTLVFTCWVKKKADRLLDLHDIFCVVDYRLFDYFILSFFYLPEMLKRKCQGYSRVVAMTVVSQLRFSLSWLPFFARDLRILS